MNGRSMYDNRNRCSCCGLPFNDGDHSTVIIPDVEIEVEYKDKLHLKLSPEAINARKAKLYCNNCLNFKEFVIK